jgi:hypothetical protein
VVLAVYSELPESGVVILKDNIAGFREEAKEDLF